MLAPLISEPGWIVPRVGRFSKSNSNLHGQPGSMVKSHPTDGVTDGLRVRGNMRLYFEGCNALAMHHVLFIIADCFSFVSTMVEFVYVWCYYMSWYETIEATYLYL
jgi:hypothetical protein